MIWFFYTFEAYFYFITNYIILRIYAILGESFASKVSWYSVYQILISLKPKCHLLCVFSIFTVSFGLNIFTGMSTAWLYIGMIKQTFFVWAHDPHLFVYFIFLRFLFIYSWKTQRERESETQAEEEAGSTQGAWLGTRSPVSRNTPWLKVALNRWAT